LDDQIKKRKGLAENITQAEETRNVQRSMLGKLLKRYGSASLRDANTKTYFEGKKSWIEPADYKVHLQAFTSIILKTK
jgi:predicted Zn-dependent peptidase